MLPTCVEQAVLVVFIGSFGQALSPDWCADAYFLVSDKVSYPNNIE